MLFLLPFTRKLVAVFLAHVFSENLDYGQMRDYFAIDVTYLYCLLFWCLAC